MIAHLRGSILEKQPGRLVLEAGGVGYDIAVSIHSFTSLPAAGAQAALFIHTHVREDALSLFGFAAREEKQLFERLITVSGVGPRLAITILGGLTPERLVAALRAQDHATLTRIPGVGKKLAERLVVELRDKLEGLGGAPAPVAGASAAGPAAEDVLSALVNLGYQRASAQKAVDSATARDKALGSDFDGLFRAALQLIR
jgi:Holliday junction DNA helicase RuvA